VPGFQFSLSFPWKKPIKKMGNYSFRCQAMRAPQTREHLFNQGLKGLQCPAPTGLSSYIPLNLRGLMCGERLTFSLYLKAGDNQFEGFKYFPYLDAGEVLDSKWLEPLDRIGIKCLYFHNTELDNVLAYLNNHLQLLGQEGPVQTKRKFMVLSEHLSLTLRQVMAAPRLGAHIEPAFKQVDRIIEELQKDKNYPRMVWEILFRNYSLYNHAVNVCLLAVAFMLFLRKSQRDSRLLGSAALFLDLGMTRIPEKILYKSESLTPEEWEETKRHPLIGMQILKRASTLPAEGMQLVLEHHENADGSGYPEGLSLPRQHPWTRILRLVDAYDYLTANRANRPGQTPFAVLKFFQKQEGPRGPVFERRTVKDFIRFLALC
jgi:HD-GYP domain-containing protein (c-di-GMP phosphodiesterase class II)